MEHSSLESQSRRCAKILILTVSGSYEQVSAFCESERNNRGASSHGQMYLYNEDDSIDVATNSRSMIFVTIVSCVCWCVCVFDPIHSGASLRLSVYV